MQLQLTEGTYSAMLTRSTTCIACEQALGLGVWVFVGGGGGGGRERNENESHSVPFPHPLPPTKTQTPSSRACSQATTCKEGQTPRCQISTYNGFNRGKLESLFFLFAEVNKHVIFFWFKKQYSLPIQCWRLAPRRKLSAADKLGKAIAWHWGTLKTFLSDSLQFIHNFGLSLHFIPSLQSAVCILYLVYILYPVCSLQSAVCSLHFVLTVFYIVWHRLKFAYRQK